MVAPYYANPGKIARICRAMKSARFTVLLATMALAGCQQDPRVQQPPAAATPAAAAASAKSEGTADSFFRDELSRSGEWIDLAGYGACWYPSNVSPAWRPYTRGRWVWTDGVGWLWVGSERWSWACDHYGRWMFADSHGWVWVPGKQWSPAWIAMRSGNDYIGWAPLPPPGKGVAELDVSKLQTRDILPAAFSFVPVKSFLDAKIFEHLEPVTRNVTLLDLTQDVTRYEVVDERLINRGVALAQVEAAQGGLAAEHFVVVEMDRPRAAEIRGRDVMVYRPEVIPTDPSAVMALTRPQPVDSEQMASQRQRMDEYHRQLREQMDTRHAQELASIPMGMSRGELEVRQTRERQVFEDQRQREVEALRRLQRDQRERQDPQRQAQAQRPAGGNEPHKYELPPEWQLSPEMMNPPMPPAKQRQ
jgi:hypothetical protein